MYFPVTLRTNNKAYYGRDERWKDGEAGMVHGNKCVPCLLYNTTARFLLKFNPNAVTQLSEGSSKAPFILYFFICTGIYWQ